jgi:hypothetical protein
MSAVLKQVEIPITDLTTIQEVKVPVLTLVQRVAVALDTKATERKLVKLVKQSLSIKTVTNGDGREECHTAYMVLRNTRVAIAKAGKTAREDAQAFSKEVIKEEGRLIELITPEENRLLGLRDGFDEKCKRDEEERIAKEVARMDAINARIDAIRAIASTACQTSKAIATYIATVNAIEITEEEFEEFIDSATQAKTETKSALNRMLMDAIEREDAEAARQEALAAEQARMVAERARLLQIEQESAARIAVAKAELDAANAILAEQQAEMQRQMTEMARQREEMTQQQEAMRVELQRQQDALNPPAVAEETQAIEIEVAPAMCAPEATMLTLPELLCKVLPDELMPLAAPAADEMILVIAECWDVSQDVARAWLINTNFSK